MERVPTPEVKTSAAASTDAALVPFVKMHGLGNDYVYLDEREGDLPDPGPWAPVLADRHRGIGSDGIIVLRRDRDCPVRMEMVNADGSRSGMCGNGIRCVARLARERGYATEDAFEIAVDDGRCAARILREGDDPNGSIVAVSIDLGVPRVGADLAASALDVEPEVIDVSGTAFSGVAIDVGNPHFVHRLGDLAGSSSDLTAFPLGELGPRVEHHPRFPHRTNVGIAHVLDRATIDLRVWERGSGETQACGSGATAAATAMRARGLVGDDVAVRVLGGTLRITFDAQGHAWMTGAAEESFRGVFRRGLVSS